MVVWEGLTDLVPETGLTEPIPWSIEQASAYSQDQERVELAGKIIEVGLAVKLHWGTWITLTFFVSKALPPGPVQVRVKI